MDGRRTGLTEEELEKIAEKLAEKLTHAKSCPLSQSQQNEIITILATKKKAIRVTLWLAGAMVIWVLKDIYLYVRNSITWIR